MISASDSDVLRKMNSKSSFSEKFHQSVVNLDEELEFSEDKFAADEDNFDQIGQQELSSLQDNSAFEWLDEFELSDWEYQCILQYYQMQGGGFLPFVSAKNGNSFQVNLEEIIRWRIEKKLDFSFFRFLNHHLDQEISSLHRSSGKSYVERNFGPMELPVSPEVFQFHGVDIDGYPIGIIRMRHHVEAISGQLSNHGPYPTFRLNISEMALTLEILRYYLVSVRESNEFFHQNGHSESRNDGGAPVPKRDQMTVILDFTDASYGNIDVEASKSIFNLLHFYFPRCIKRVLVYNISWVLKSTWSMMYNMVPQQMADAISKRVIFLNRNSDLFEYADKSEILEEFGGTIVNEFCGIETERLYYVNLSQHLIKSLPFLQKMSEKFNHEISEGFKQISSDQKYRTMDSFMSAQTSFRLEDDVFGERNSTIYSRNSLQSFEIEENEDEEQFWDCLSTISSTSASNISPRRIYQQELLAKRMPGRRSNLGTTEPIVARLDSHLELLNFEDDKKKQTNFERFRNWAKFWFIVIKRSGLSLINVLMTKVSQISHGYDKKYLLYSASGLLFVIIVLLKMRNRYIFRNGVLPRFFEGYRSNGR